MKRKSAYVLTAALLLPVSALAWNGKAVDPAKQVPASTATATGQASAEPAAPATGEAAQAGAQVEATAEAKVEANAEAKAEVKTEAKTETAVAGALIGAPQPGKGQIVFFRPSKFVGGAIGYKVREGTTELGKLRNGKFFVASVEPGAHEYTVHSEAKDILNLEVEAGETYYVQGTVTMGVFAGRPNLSPSTQAEFDAISAKLKRASE